MSRCTCCFKQPIKPEAFVCETCCEEGAIKRKCCNGQFCAHCYTKNKSCPRCITPTRIEKMTGATFMLPIFSDHEECRICLDPGIKRKCCGNYYCDDCFFQLSKCRSCNAPVEAAAFSMRAWSRAYVITIMLGWAVSLVVVLLVLFVAGTATLNTLSEPVGINGFHCTGFFRTCELSVCIDMPTPVASSGVDALPSLGDWRYCHLSSTRKLRSAACVFDAELYAVTNNALGFDVCSKEFSEGVFVFEDTFEHWVNASSFKSNALASGLWSDVFHGQVSSACGAGAAGGAQALVFYGEVGRYAITQDLDLRHGGRIEAQLFIAPLDFDSSHPQCRGSYEGVVSVQFSVDRGDSWTDIANFEPVAFRQQHFFPIALEVPVQARSSSVRFRFIQLQFEVDRDNWAVDDLRILSYLAPAWKTSNLTVAVVAESVKSTQFAQCCFDTNECKHRLTDEQLQGCYGLPGFSGRRYTIRAAEVWILIAVALSIVKFLYVSVQGFLVNRRLPFQAEIEELLLLDFIRSRIPPRFRMKKELDDFVSNVHRAARLNSDHVAHLQDEAGEGAVRVRTAEETELTRVKAKEKRRRAIKKRIKELRREGLPTAEQEVMLEDLDALEEARDVREKRALDFASAPPPSDGKVLELATELDDLKRTNMSLLRLPFDTRVAHGWVYGFAALLIGILCVLLLYRVSSTAFYTLHASIRPFGLYSTELQITSFGLNFLALICDAKEIYHLIRYVVPLHTPWVPLITVDKSDDVNALYIGEHTIGLEDIVDSHVFPVSFTYLCAAACIFAGLPFNLILLVIREQDLEQAIMLYLVPIFGTIILLRVVLGPTFVIKIAFCLQYLLDIDFETREKMGIAMKASKVKYSALVAAVGLSLIGLLVGSAVASQYAGIIFGALIAVGLVYGAFAGCIHSLPIRPWFVLTTLEAGTWLHLKKKQRCPCVYWWSFCTDVHVNDEMFIVFPTDDVRFFSVLKGVSGL